ncbi:MAG: YigZ family protein [Bacillota bacterium]
MDKFLTISKIGTSIIVEKKSTFLGHAAPVQDEKEALEFINKIKMKLADANHHTYAYQIGENNEIQRANDGGEPSGTAGRPILEIIKQENLKDIVVVVSRYFGGILLGTGGLVRAYGKTAHEAIIDGSIIEKIYGQNVFITIDYHLWGKVQNYLNTQDIYIEKVSYTEKVKVSCLVAFEKVNLLTKEVQDLCHGAVGVTLGEVGYFSGI